MVYTCGIIKRGKKLYNAVHIKGVSRQQVPRNHHDPTNQLPKLVSNATKQIARCPRSNISAVMVTYLELQRIHGVPTVVRDNELEDKVTL